MVCKVGELLRYLEKGSAGGSYFKMDEEQDSSACAGNAGNAYASTLCVLEHKLVSLLPVSDPSSDPQSVAKWLSNLLTTLRYKSKNVNQYLANMNDACKGEMKISFPHRAPSMTLGT